MKLLGTIKRQLYSMFFDSKPSEIIENIYQGNICSSFQKENLKKLGITHILTVGNYLPLFYKDNFKYMCIKVKDKSDENLLQYFEEGFKFIDDCINSGGKILIHCAAGYSRSTTMTCVFLIKKKSITVDEAIEIVKTARPEARPNPGFKEQLEKWYIFINS